MKILSAGLVKSIVFENEQERDEYISTLTKHKEKDYAVLEKGDTKLNGATKFQPYLLVIEQYEDYGLCYDIDVR